MANWCFNTVDFKASANKIKKLRRLFRQMNRKAEKELCGQLPPFLNDNGGYFFDLDWDECDTLRYQTKWSPNIETLIQIANRYKVGFTISYEELGNLVYGEATYLNGNLMDAYLDDEDFDKYDFIEDKCQWVFEGKAYECDFEILEILLERKKANLLINKNVLQ